VVKKDKNIITDFNTQAGNNTLVRAKEIMKEEI
jgi:hypothetical protein